MSKLLRVGPANKKSGRPELLPSVLQAVHNSAAEGRAAVDSGRVGRANGQSSDSLAITVAAHSRRDGLFRRIWLFGHSHLLHYVALLDRIDYLLTLDHLAKNGVYSIEMWGGYVGDEELRAVGVWAGIGH